MLASAGGVVIKLCFLFAYHEDWHGQVTLVTKFQKDKNSQETQGGLGEIRLLMCQNRLVSICVFSFDPK